jgi:hypothetical protein
VTGLLCELPAPRSSRRREPPKKFLAIAELFKLTIVAAVGRAPVSGGGVTMAATSSGPLATEARLRRGAELEELIEPAGPAAFARWVSFPLPLARISHQRVGRS